MRLQMRSAAKAAVGLLTAVMLAACGAGAGEGNAVGADVDSEEVKAAVAEAEEVVANSVANKAPYPGPTTPFAPGAKKGMVIAANFSTPVIRVACDEAVLAMRTMGWTTPDCLDGKYEPSTVGNYIDQAIADGVAGITIVSFNIPDLKPYLERAEDAGVGIACVNCGDDQMARDLGVIPVDIDFEAEGELMGSLMIAKSQGEGSFVLTIDKSFAPPRARVKGATRVLKESLGVEPEIVEIPIADSTKPGPPQWEAFLQQHAGEVIHAAGYYDGVALQMGITADTQGLGDVSVYGYDADDAVIQKIADGGSMVADIGIPYGYQVWAAADLLAREAAGESLWEQPDKMPTQIIDRSIAGEYKPWPGPEGDWKTEIFGKSWQK